MIREIAKRLQETKVQLLLITLVTVGVYVNTFQNQFVWDDTEFVNWPAIQSFENVGLFFKGVLPATHLGDYRPFKGIILAIAYKISTDNPWGYHLVAILIHLATTLMVYLVVRQLFANRLDKTPSSLIAFLTAVIFGIHPIHTEAVTFITASSDTIGVTFFFISLYFYIKASHIARGRKQLVLASIIFAILAFLAYEMTLILPLILILYDTCFKQTAQKPLRKRLLEYAFYFGLIGLYAIWRYGFLHLSEGKNYIDGNFLLTMFAMVKVFGQYVLLLIFPHNLTVTHEISKGVFALAEGDFNKAAFVGQRITDGQFLVSLGLLTILVAVALLIYKKLPVVTFCVFWFFIALAPVSNIFPLGTLMAERYLYLASFGFCLLAAWFLFIFYSKWKWAKFLALPVLGVIVFGYFFLTIKRNIEWKGPFSLWSASVERAPKSAISNFNLGNYYHKTGDLDNALKYYLIAYGQNENKLAQFPLFLGEVYSQQGKNEEALKYYKEALGYATNDFGRNYTLARIKQISGDEIGAVEAYKRAILSNPTYFNSHVNLGVLYARQGKTDKAIREFNVAKAINPKTTISYLNLAHIYKETKQYDAALTELETALKIVPNSERIKLAIEELKSVYKKW